MSEYLFVYGTLMNPIQSTIADYLHHNSDFLGIGSFPGVLYDLGKYPGAVYDTLAGSMVHGHVFVLQNVIKMLEKLDRYESISVNDSFKSEYRRALVPVKIEHQSFNCWVYLYNLPTDGLTKIPGGHYLNYLKTNEAHQNFIKNIDFEDFTA